MALINLFRWIKDVRENIQMAWLSESLTNLKYGNVIIEVKKSNFKNTLCKIHEAVIKSLYL